MADTILFLMDGWDSSAGGIQTVNRELILGLARTRPDLNCVALVTAASDTEVEHAFRNNVTMIRGESRGNWSSALLSPDLKTIEPGDVLAVAGHSYFSGQEAIQLRDRFFPEALAAQFIHMNPMRVEGNKEAKADSYIRDREEKLARELAIARKADLVFCIGPRLYRYMRDQFAAQGGDVEAVVRLDCGLSGELNQDRVPPIEPTVLCLGRTESMSVKGLDIFAYAAGLIDADWRQHPLTAALPVTPRFVVRGAESKPEQLEAALRGIAKQAGGTPKIDVRPYTTNREDLSSDLRGASAFLMPSREEGFGLVACEALSLDTPIVVSRESGMAELIGEVGRSSGLSIDKCIVDMTGSLESIAKRFADATLPILLGRQTEDAFFPRLKAHLLPLCSWESGARQFVSALEKSARGRGNASPGATPSEAGSTAPQRSVQEPTTPGSDTLAEARTLLMNIEGVVGVSLKYAIVALVERGSRPVIPHEINGTQVILREIDKIELTSTRKNSSCQLVINGQPAATIGLFAVDLHDDVFVVTVGHAFESLDAQVSMRIDGQDIPLSVQVLDDDEDWAVLRVPTGVVQPSWRDIGQATLGSRVRIELPGQNVEGAVESVELSAMIGTSGGQSKRYDGMFEVRVEADVGFGASGALVTDQTGRALGILVAGAKRDDGQVSLFVRDIHEVLRRHGLAAATIEKVPEHPTIGVIATDGEMADTLFRGLNKVRRIRRGNRIYFSGRLDDKVRVICAVLRTAGNVSAAITTSMLVTDHAVDAVFVLGLCGGLQTNQRIGDIIIASEIIHYGQSKITEGEVASRSFTLTPNYVRPLLDSVKTSALLHDIPSEFNVYFGAIASVDSVIDHTSLEQLRGLSRGVLGIDMESKGVVDAITTLESNLPVYIVRVIADLPASKILPDYAQRDEMIARSIVTALDLIRHFDSEWAFSASRMYPPTHFA